MKVIDNGGSAFPLAGSSDYSYAPQDGMSLRDWFAGQALLAIPHIYHDLVLTSAGAAELAYKIADEMIESRKGGYHD